MVRSMGRASSINQHDEMLPLLYKYCTVYSYCLLQTAIANSQHSQSPSPEGSNPSPMTYPPPGRRCERVVFDGI